MKKILVTLLFLFVTILAARSEPFDIIYPWQAAIQSVRPDSGAQMGVTANMYWFPPIDIRKALQGPDSLDTRWPVEGDSLRLWWHLEYWSRTNATINGIATICPKQDSLYLFWSTCGSISPWDTAYGISGRAFVKDSSQHLAVQSYSTPDSCADNFTHAEGVKSIIIGKTGDVGFEEVPTYLWIGVEPIGVAGQSVLDSTSSTVYMHPRLLVPR